MKIQILGPGCPKCKKLAENVEVAVKDLGIEAEVTKVTALKEIMDRGVMLTPGLAVDGEVKSAGKLLTVDEVKRMLG